MDAEMVPGIDDGDRGQPGNRKQKLAAQEGTRDWGPALIGLWPTVSVAA